MANTANNQTINRRIVNAIAAGASFSKNAAVSIPKIPTPTVNKAVKTGAIAVDDFKQQYHEFNAAA